MAHRFLSVTPGQSKKDSIWALGLLWIYVVRKEMKLLWQGWLWAEGCHVGKPICEAVTKPMLLPSASFSYFSALENQSGCCHCYHQRNKKKKKKGQCQRLGWPFPCTSVFSVGTLLRSAPQDSLFLLPAPSPLCGIQPLQFTCSVGKPWSGSSLASSHRRAHV